MDSGCNFVHHSGGVFTKIGGKVVETIVTEMGKGNFSFLILVVGIIQVILMAKNNGGKK